VKKNQLKKVCISIVLFYLAIGVLFNLIAGKQLLSSSLLSESIVSPERLTEEITKDCVLNQPIDIIGDEFNGVTLYASTYERDNIGNLYISLLANGETLETTTIAITELKNNEKFFAEFTPISIDENYLYTLQVKSDSVEGSSISLYYGTNYSFGKGSIKQVINNANSLRINDNHKEGMLYYEISSKEYHWFGQYYWKIFMAGFFLLSGYIGYTLFCFSRSKTNIFLNALENILKYKFLIVQLIERDFKNKYKRSSLGVFWSLLNPVLTMTVQYLVFSLLFKSNIENYALYLIIGIVLFSFFSEATSISSQAIVSNATLITKVAMPKAIYPISSILSSSVNLIISLIPLLMVMLITGTEITPAAVLIVFALLCLLLCSMGIGLLLSALMVFFRDIQFLWGVITMIWMYITPIFYPINILPNWLIVGMQYNPMYHIITFVRTILIDGVSPAPGAYLACLLSAVIPFIIGRFVFEKLEDRFVLYL